MRFVKARLLVAVVAWIGKVCRYWSLSGEAVASGVGVERQVKASRALAVVID